MNTTNEKIVYTAWSFVELRCHEHGKELHLRQVNGKPYYCCAQPECTVRVPAAVYEKIRMEVVKRINTDKFGIGIKWVHRYLKVPYQCKVISVVGNLFPVISIRVMK